MTLEFQKAASDESKTQATISPDEYLKQKKINGLGIALTGTETVVTDRQYSTAAEIEARIKIQEAEALSRLRIAEMESQAERNLKDAEAEVLRKLKLLNFLFKDVSAHSLAIVLVLVLMLISALSLFDKHASSQSQDWARATLTAISGAVAGYLFGKGDAA